MKSSGLITNEDLASLDSVVDQLVSNIQDHTNLGIVDSHQNVTVENTPVFDNDPNPYDDSPNSPLGNKVGDVTLIIKANGFIYRIPASTRPTGPIKVPKYTVNPPSSGRLFYVAGGGVQPPAVDGAPGYYPVSATASSGQPTKVGWQVYLNSGGWTNIKKDTYYQFNVIQAGQPSAYVTRFRVDGVDRFSALGAGEDISYTTTGTSVTPVSTTNEIGLWVNSPGGNCDYSGLVQIRAVFDNTAQGGGVRYSTAFTLDFSDRAPCCWFFSTAHITQRLSQEQWVQAGNIERELFKRYRRPLAWYIFNGEELVRRMKSKGVQQSYFEDFTKRMLDLWGSDRDEAIKAYIKEVIQVTTENWPEITTTRRFQAAAKLTGQYQ
jgi:hypothetical protein